MTGRVGRLSVLVLCARYCAGHQLVLLSYDPINVDGSGSTASTHLRLKNTEKAASSCTLSTDDFTSTNTGKKLGVTPTFYDKDTGAVAGRAAGSTVTVNFDADEDFSVKLDLTHMIEAGESKAGLYCNGKAMGKLVALKQLGLPFKLTLADNAELAFVKDRPLTVQLKNDDFVTYPFTWQLLIKGKPAQGTETLGPNDLTSLAITPNSQWFSAYQSFFKDEMVDGQLMLRYHPQGGLAADSFPAKLVPVKARLNYFPPGRRDLLAAGLILVVLAVGGLLSAYFNVDLVNRLRMVGVKKRLAKLAKQTGEIAPELTSHLRVALLLEHKRISAELPKRTFFTPETASVCAQCAADIDSLEARVKLAAQVSDAAARLGRAIDTGDIAVSLAARAERGLIGAQDLLRKAALMPDELQRVQVLIADATNFLNDLDTPNSVLEQTLVNRLQDLQARFTDAIKQDSIFAVIKKAAPVPFSLLSSGESGGSQAERDANSRKLQVVLDLIRMQSAPRDQMLAALSRQDPRSVHEAELLLRESKDGIAAADLEAAISASPPQFSLIIDRDVVRVNRASMMKVVFNSPRHNQAAAKRRLECTWQFGHDNFTERGWEICHYFPQVRTYEVSVVFRDENRAVIPQGNQAPKLNIDVKAPYPEGRSQWLIEFQRWLIGFLIAVLGLFAGAKDKVLSLDPLGAIFAVFLLGFTIDMAKNLLVPKQS